MKNRNPLFSFVFILLLLKNPANPVHPPRVYAAGADAPAVSFPAPARTWKSPGHKTYYADSLAGNDASDGSSAAKAWKSLDRINAGEFAAGDRILLKAGSAWRGFLAPGGSGRAGAPIVLTSYGRGARPKIDGEGQTLAALYLFNAEQWDISGLDIANTGKVRQPNLAGVQVRLEDFGTAHHVHLKRLEIHDVTGSLIKSEGGGAGISCTNGGKIKSRFDDLLIEGCHLVRTDRNGISMGGYWSRGDWFPSLHVVIRSNLLEDIGGDGIVPIGCDGALIERNVGRGGRMRCADSAAGIWPWSCDNTVVQYNEVSGMKGTVDGQGFDSDWNCRNSLFQYNYSHDNDGGFMLICNDGGVKLPWSLGNVGTIIRYNISQNDGERTFHITGPCRDTLIYNNTIYIGPKLRPALVLAGNWGGDWSENTRFFNNIFYVEGKARCEMGGLRQTVFENNAYYGTIENRPDDAKAIISDPQLFGPGGGAGGFESLHVYRLADNSPLLRRGKKIPNNGGRDFRGDRLPRDTGPNIGAM